MVSNHQVRELVAKARAGDKQCVGQLFDLFVDRVYRFLRHRMPSTEAAEDVTQTVFLEMIQSLPRYQEQANAKFSTWLFQIARHRLIDFYRRQKREVSLEDVPEPAVEMNWSDPVGYNRLHQAVASLPERYATVLQLRYQEDLPAAEVAKIMHTSPMNVRVLQHRALKTLRRQFHLIPLTSSKRRFAAELP